jgi:hypothetical protein
MYTTEVVHGMRVPRYLPPYREYYSCSCLIVRVSGSSSDSRQWIITP